MITLEVLQLKTKRTARLFGRSRVHESFRFNGFFMRFSKGACHSVPGHVSATCGKDTRKREGRKEQRAEEREETGIEEKRREDKRTQEEKGKESRGEERREEERRGEESRGEERRGYVKGR